RGVMLAYPRVAGNELRLHRVVQAQELTPSGRYRIPEPPADAPLVDAAQLQVIVVPGLAFDADGYRVGYGKGYYDLLLPHTARARRIGAAYDFQVIERCPRELGDQPV